MKKQKFKSEILLLFLACVFFFSSNAYAEEKPFIFNIDGPAENQECCGYVEMGGWAIYGGGVSDVVLYINNVPVCKCSRSSRTDVANAYPGYPSGSEGFSCKVDGAVFSEGANQIFFRAYTNNNANVIMDFGQRTVYYTHTKPLEAMVDAPQEGQIYSGFFDVGGWAVAGDKVEEVVLYVNDQPACSLPMYAREDIAQAYPQYSTGKDGFGLRINGNSYFNEGSNSIFFRAYTKDRKEVVGDFGQRTITYHKQREFQNYVEGPYDQQECSGMVSMSGWALYGEGVSAVELYVNDQLVCECNRVDRPDTAAENPGYPSGNEGFECRVDGNTVFNIGDNSIYFRAYTNNNQDVLGDFGHRTIKYAPQKEFLNEVDTPADGAECSGFVSFLGWAIYGEGVSSVMLYVNDQPVANSKLTDRNDVAQEHPGYPSGNEGFECRVNGNDVFKEGENTVYFRAYTNDNKDVLGDFGHRTIKFQKIRPLVTYVECPSEGQACTGVVSMTGWAVYGESISDVVLYVNGKPVCDCEREDREDVAADNPGYPKGLEGFNCTVNGNQVFKDGENTIFFRAYANDKEDVIGDFGKRTIQFTPQKDFKYYIESPLASTPYSGYVDIKGWAIYGEGVSDVVMYVNGQQVCNCTKEARTDVANEYPGYPKGSEGFSYRVYGNDVFEEGENTIFFRAYTDKKELIQDFGEQTLIYNHQLPFRFFVEGPDDGETYSGDVEVGGWALYKDGISKITLYLNGQMFGDCTLESRDDVSNTYVGYPKGKEGFSITIPKAQLTEGNNTLYFCAYTEGSTAPVETFGNRTIKYVIESEGGDQTETKDISAATVTLTEDTFVYDGTEKNPSPTVVCEGVTLKRNIDYSVRYFNHINAGTADIVIMGKGKYTGGTRKTFTIKKAEQTIKEDNMETKVGNTLRINFTAIGTMTYSSDNEEIATVDAGGVIHAISVGSAKITVKASGNNNYDAIEKTITVKVNEKEFVELFLEDASLEYETCKYDGREKQPTVTIQKDDEILTLSEDYSVTYADNVDVGTATVFITGKGEFTGAFTMNFQIEKADQNLLTSDDMNIAIGETANISVTGYGDISYETDNETVATVTDKGIVKAVGYGTAHITVKASGDRKHNQAQKAITITILKKELSEDTAKVYLNSEDYIATGKEIKPEIIVFYGLTLLKENRDYEISYRNNINAGEADVIITGIGEYEGTYVQSFMITEKKTTENPSGDETEQSTTEENDSQTGDNTQTGGDSQTGGENQTGGSSQTGENPQTGGNNQTGENPQTGGSTQTGENPQTGESTQTGENPQTGGNTQTGENPQTGGSIQTGENPQTGGSDQTSENPQTGNDNQKENDTQSDKNTTENASGSQQGSTVEKQTDSSTEQNTSGGQTSTVEDQTGKATDSSEISSSTEQIDKSQSTTAEDEDDGETSDEDEKSTPSKQDTEKQSSDQKSSGQSGTEAKSDAATGGTNVTKSTEKSTSESAKTTETATVSAPAKVTGLTLKASKKKQLKITFKKVKGVKGYEISYSTSKKFKGVTSVVTTKQLKYTLKKLKSKKKYYVRVRAYILNANGEKVFGKYSSVKNKQIK